MLVRYLFAALLLALTVASPQRTTVHAQQQPAPPLTKAAPTSLTNAPLTHLGIVVPDIEKVARGYADIWGIAVPEIKTISLEMTNGKKAEARVAYVPLPNFYIEILQPVTKAGALHDHLQKFGIGIHHLGVGIDTNLDAVRAELVSKDGKWTGGVKGGTWAFVDFRHTPLGATLEIGPTARPAMPAPPTEQSGLFGGRPISHVGWANIDTQAALDKIVQVFGRDYPSPRRFPDTGWFPYPPNMWTTEGWVQVVQVQSANKIGMELIQGFGGPNPWDAFIKQQKGTAPMHIAVGRGKIPRDEWLRVGQEKGGKWTNGGPPPDGTFAYLDWSETLGLVIE